MYAPAKSWVVPVISLLLYAAAATAAGVGMHAEAVVRAEVRALNEGNAAAVLALFAREATVFSVPQHPERLTGALSEKLGTHEQRKAFYTDLFARRSSLRVELLDAVCAGDLVVAKLRFTHSPDEPRPEYVLAIYRVREGVIHNLWHVARSHEDRLASARNTEKIIRSFAQANNRGDVQAFLAFFSPQARIFRNSGDPFALGDKPSVTMVDEKSRRAAYMKMFANGAPAQVETLGTVALGNLIAAREVATLPDGKVLDEISVYRIERGRIVHDWFIFNESRP